MATSRASAERFLEALATMTYELRTKHHIPQEDLVLNVHVRIDELVELPDAFKQVSRQ